MREGARAGRAAVRDDVRGRFAAIERVVASLLPLLQRWAPGRLPAYARRRMDTGDVVQEAIVGALRNLQESEAAEPEALARYLAVSIRNRIADEVRRARIGEVRNGGGERTDGSPSPLEELLESESQRAYRTALLRLGSDDQALLVGRIELGLSFEDLALATQRPSPDSARVATRRAALRLARAMGRPQTEDGPSGGTMPK